MMTTPEVQGLLLVMERQQRLRDAKASSLQLAEQRLAQLRAQGSSLLQYRSDIAHRWVTPRDSGAPAQQLRTARQFIDRLDEALDQQQPLVQRAQALVEQLRAELVDAEVQLAGLNRLIERRVQALTAQRMRSEQKAVDETARQVLAARQTQGPIAIDSPGGP